MKPIEVIAQGDTAEVLVYDQIGNSWLQDGLTAKAFAESLKAAGPVKTINVRINSPGGSVFEATAIYNTLVNHGAAVNVHIEGAALSAASLVAMAGDEIKMAANGFLMIHDPVGRTTGDAAEMRRAAEMLDKIKATLVATYAGRTGQDPEAISKMMTAETWMDAKEAKKLGFITSISKKADLAVAASADAREFFRNAPDRFREICDQRQPTPEPKETTMAETPNTPAPAAPVAPVAASYEQIVATCAGADEKFICKQLAAKATQEQARDAWMVEMKSRLDAAEAKAAEAAKVPAKPGVEPLATAVKLTAATAAVDDPCAAWNEAVAAKVKSGLPRSRAVSTVAKENPDLHRDYLAAYNTQHGRKQAAAALN